jgi:hypothetical protein
MKMSGGAEDRLGRENALEGKRGRGMSAERTSGASLDVAGVNRRRAGQLSIVDETVHRIKKGDPNIRIAFHCCVTTCSIQNS